jgi:hypothetical protein
MTLPPQLHDLDNVNDVFEAKLRYVTAVDIDPADPSTQYGSLLAANAGRINDALRWPPEAFIPDAFDGWSQAMQDQLRVYILRLEKGLELPVSNRPTPIVNIVGDERISLADARDSYLAYVAHTLWFEVHGSDLFQIDWSLLDLDTGGLFDYTYLRSRDLLSPADPDAEGNTTYNFLGIGQGGATVSMWNPRVVFHFLAALDIIRPTQAGTAFALTDWWRAHSTHGSALGTFEEKYGVSYPPYDAIYFPIEGFLERHSVDGIGCQQSSNFFAEAAVTINLPAIGETVSIHQPGHRAIRLPFARKQCDGPGENGCCSEPPCCASPPCADTDGIVLGHADHLYGASTNPWGNEIVDSSWIWLSAEEAETVLLIGDPPYVLECGHNQTVQAGFNLTRYVDLLTQMPVTGYWSEMYATDGAIEIQNQLSNPMGYYNCDLFSAVEQDAFVAAIEAELVSLGPPLSAGSEWIQLRASKVIDGFSPAYTEPITANIAPVSSASGPATVMIGDCVELDGSASSDADAGPETLTYLWTCDDPAIQIGDANKSVARFGAPLSATVLTCTLTVSDGADMDQSMVTLAVDDPGGPLPLLLTGVERVLPEPQGMDKNRYISFVVPPELAGQSIALRVRLTSLHDPEAPIPPGTPDFSASEGEYRYVNSFTGVSPPDLDCEDSAAFGTTYKCAKLGCDPEWADWAALLGTDVLNVTSREVIPSSQYDVDIVRPGAGGSCSSPLLVETSRHGDVDGSGQVDVSDLVHTIDRVKDIPGSAFTEIQAYIRDTDPNPRDRSPNVTDITIVVDALKLVPYALAGPTVCP